MATLPASSVPPEARLRPIPHAFRRFKVALAESGLMEAVTQRIADWYPDILWYLVGISALAWIVFVFVR